MPRLSVKKHSGSFLDTMIYTGEPGIGSSAGIASIELAYPMTEMNFLGLEMHWIYVFLILMLVVAFAFKGVFKVTI